MRSLLHKTAPFLLLGMLMISSCAQTEISKLEGNWQLFWINDLADPDIYVWQFEGGDLTIVRYEAGPNGASVAARAKYKTSADFLDARVTISDHVQANSSGAANAMISNGDWTIDKITNDVLRLSTTDQGGYVIREFQRAQ